MKTSQFTLASLGALFCLFAALIMVPAQSYASGSASHGTGEVGYNPDNFPYHDRPMMSPYQGETNTYMYDLQISATMRYWSEVIDNLATKFSRFEDNVEEIDTADKMWDLITDNNIELDAQQKKIMCLYLERDESANPPETSDEIPTSEQIANFPAWPNCGGVLEQMFGPNFVRYVANQHSINDNDEDSPNPKLEVFRTMLESIGVNPEMIEGTLQAQAMEAGLAGGSEVTLGQGAGGTAPRECYNAANNMRSYEVTGCGILCTVTKIIMALLNGASKALVEATTSNGQFQAAITGALILYTVIYGAMVLLGIVRVGLGDALVRLAKMGVVAMLITSDFGMTFFHMIRCFFIEGTSYLISVVQGIGLEAATRLNGAALQPINLNNYGGGEMICTMSFMSDPSAETGPVGPLVVLEALVTQVFSPQMFLVFITLLTSTVQGVILALFLAFGAWGFVMALMGAVTIYLTSLIAQYLLLSLMPFFLAFLLFERTKYLFEGWINQLVSYSLAPIFMFAYISLFILVIEAALAQILDVTICWYKWYTVVWIFDIYKWTFWDTHIQGPAVDLPFGFFEILIFILLVFLMKEFQTSVEQIAIDIGNSYVYASNAANALQGWFKDKGKDLRHKQLERAASGGKRVGSAIRGGVGGHSTNSQSGQTGTGGAAGAKQQTARKGPK